MSEAPSRIRIRRTTAANRTNETPAQSELVHETDTGALYIGDGSTAGGVLLSEGGATADQTAADIRALGFFDTSNDGSGSGLDADLVDGNEASALLARANHTGTQLLATISDAGALASLDTAGSSEIDDEAVTYAKLQHITGPALIGRSTGAGDPSSLSGNLVLAITLADRTAHEVICMSGTAGVSSPVTMAANGFLGRNGTSDLASAAVDAGEFVMHPNDGGGLGAYGGRAAYQSMLEDSRGTSFPASPDEGEEFYRSDLEHWFYWDSSRSKWLGRELMVSRSAKNNWDLNQNGFISGSNTGGGAGDSMLWDVTIVGASIRANSAPAGDCDFEIRETDPSATVTTLGTVTLLTGARDFTDDTLNLDTSEGDALFVRRTAGASSISGLTTFNIFYRRHAT